MMEGFAQALIIEKQEMRAEGNAKSAVRERQVRQRTGYVPAAVAGRAEIFAPLPCRPQPVLHVGLYCRVEIPDETLAGALQPRRHRRRSAVNPRPYFLGGAGIEGIGGNHRSSRSRPL